MHAFTDGRDTPPRSAGDYLRDFRDALPDGVPIATVCGRYYAMDRDRRWERAQKAYLAIAEAEGPHFATPTRRSRPPTRRMSATSSSCPP